MILGGLHVLHGLPSNTQPILGQGGPHIFVEKTITSPEAISQELAPVSEVCQRRRRVILLRVTRTFTTFRVTGTTIRLSLVRLGVHLMGCQLDNLRRDFCSVCCPCFMVDPMLLMSAKPEGRSSSSLKPNKARASLRTQIWETSAKES